MCSVKEGVPLFKVTYICLAVYSCFLYFIFVYRNWTKVAFFLVYVGFFVRVVGGNIRVVGYFIGWYGIFWLLD